MAGAVAVIDGDVISCASTTRELVDGSHRVVSFDTAGAFFSRSDASVPSCLVVDGRLSDMTCQQFQTECARRALPVPIIFVVGETQVGLAVRLLKGGASDVLARPLEADELRRQVYLAIEHEAQTQTQGELARERLGRLTQREFEIVKLATRGLSNKDVAEQLQISFRTVEVHRRNAMRKTGSANVIELSRLIDGVLRDAAQDAHASPSAREGAAGAAREPSPESNAQLSLFPKREHVRGQPGSPGPRRPLP